MKTIPPLPKNTILLTEVGSTAHGTGIPGGEDLDQLGVVVESETEILGLSDGFRNVMQRTQPKGIRSGAGDIDRTLYSLRSFMRLAAAGNPSILLSFWAPVVEETDEGELLRSLGFRFIGRHIIPRYRGYMQGQALRLLGLKGSAGHGKRGGGQREEIIAKHGYDTKYAMHCARLGFQGIELLETGGLNLPMTGEVGQWLRRVRIGEISFDEWWDRALELDARLGKLRDDTVIPPGPDREVIEGYMVEIHRRFWTERSA